MNKSLIKKVNDGKDKYDYMIKLIIIGDSGVGKTNILTRFCQDIFKQTHVATIGVDFNVKTIQIEDKRLKMQVWDTAGQQRFKTITETYYKGAAGIVLVYGVDSRDSFQSIEKWIHQVNARTTSSVKKILVANKIDLKEIGMREVSTDQGKKMAQKYNLRYLQVSAKEDKQIEQIFYTLGKEIKDRLINQAHNDLEQLSRTISINMSYSQKKRVKEEEEERRNGCNC